MSAPTLRAEANQKSQITITENSKFTSFEQLYTAVQRSRISSGLNPTDLFRDTLASFSAKDALATFGSSKFHPPSCSITPSDDVPSSSVPTDSYLTSNTKAVKPFPFPRRGSFNCKGRHASGLKCPFFIPFSYFKKDKHYVVKSGAKRPLCLEHNHPIPLGSGGENSDGEDIIFPDSYRPPPKS
ncbi:hypothetical protein ACHAXR_008841 [Thalassiosira sp. AJA248-18]